MQVKGILLIAIAAAVFAGVASAAGGPPLPRAAHGAKVTVVAHGVPLPAGFAIGKGTVFAAGFGSEDGKTPGGLYAIQHGSPQLLAAGSFLGVAWKNDTLYATTGTRTGFALLALSGWNGKTFASRKTLLRSHGAGIAGLAFGPDGRLYAAGSGDCDHCDIKDPFSQAVLSLRSDGTDLRVVAAGVRNPYGITFVKGIAHPFVTVEGQENLGKHEPPDYVVEAVAGDDYGFPHCTWAKASACADYAKPFALLPAHSSPTGIAAIGRRLYIGMFNGTMGPAVWSLPVSGGKPAVAISGFPAPVVGVTASGQSLYVGDLTGTVYRIDIG